MPVINGFWHPDPIPYQKPPDPLSSLGQMIMTAIEQRRKNDAAKMAMEMEKLKFAKFKEEQKADKEGRDALLKLLTPTQETTSPVTIGAPIGSAIGALSSLPGMVGSGVKQMGNWADRVVNRQELPSFGEMVGALPPGPNITTPRLQPTQQRTNYPDLSDPKLQSQMLSIFMNTPAYRDKGDDLLRAMTAKGKGRSIEDEIKLLEAKGADKRQTQDELYRLKAQLSAKQSELRGTRDDKRNTFQQRLEAQKTISRIQLAKATQMMITARQNGHDTRVIEAQRDMLQARLTSMENIAADRNDLMEEINFDRMIQASDFQDEKMDLEYDKLDAGIAKVEMQDETLRRGQDIKRDYGEEVNRLREKGLDVKQSIAKMVNDRTIAVKEYSEMMQNNRQKAGFDQATAVMELAAKYKDLQALKEYGYRLGLKDADFLNQAALGEQRHGYNMTKLYSEQELEAQQEANKPPKVGNVPQVRSSIPQVRSSNTMVSWDKELGYPIRSIMNQDGSTTVFRGADGKPLRVEYDKLTTEEKKDIESQRRTSRETLEREKLAAQKAQFSEKMRADIERHRNAAKEQAKKGRLDIQKTWLSSPEKKDANQAFANYQRLKSEIARIRESIDSGEPKALLENKLLFTFIKNIDNSVVRPSEVELFRNATTFFNKLSMDLGRYVDDESKLRQMSADMLNQIEQNTEDAYEASMLSLSTIKKEFEDELGPYFVEQGVIQKPGDLLGEPGFVPSVGTIPNVGKKSKVFNPATGNFE